MIVCIRTDYIVFDMGPSKNYVAARGERGSEGRLHNSLRNTGEGGLERYVSLHKGEGVKNNQN